MSVRDDEMKTIESACVFKPAVERMKTVLTEIKRGQAAGLPLTTDEISKKIGLSFHITREIIKKLRDANLVRFDVRRKGWFPKISLAVSGSE